MIQSSQIYNWVLIWMDFNSNTESLIKGNLNNIPKSTSIDMLSNSPVLVSYCSIIYILHWNINDECHGFRHESKAEDSVWKRCKSICRKLMVESYSVNWRRILRVFLPDWMSVRHWLSNEATHVSPFAAALSKLTGAKFLLHHQGV